MEYCLNHLTPRTFGYNAIDGFKYCLSYAMRIHVHTLSEGLIHSLFNIPYIGDISGGI